MANNFAPNLNQHQQQLQQFFEYEIQCGFNVFVSFFRFFFTKAASSLHFLSSLSKHLCCFFFFLALLLPFPFVECFFCYLNSYTFYHGLQREILCTIHFAHALLCSRFFAFLLRLLYIDFGIFRISSSSQKEIYEKTDSQKSKRAQIMSVHTS